MWKEMTEMTAYFGILMQVVFGGEEVEKRRRALSRAIASCNGAGVTSVQYRPELRLVLSEDHRLWNLGKP